MNGFTRVQLSIQNQTSSHAGGSHFCHESGRGLKQHLDRNLRIEWFTGTYARGAVGVTNCVADLAEGAGTERASGLRIIISVVEVEHLGPQLQRRFLPEFRIFEN